jgi:hypothetical protein
VCVIAFYTLLVVLASWAILFILPDRSLLHSLNAAALFSVLLLLTLVRKATVEENRANVFQ